MLHSGLIVKQSLIVKLAIFIDSETQFYVSFWSYSKTRSFYTDIDPILWFILVIIDTETHSCVLKTARPNFIFHSGQNRDRDSFLDIIWSCETQFYFSFWPGLAVWVLWIAGNPKSQSRPNSNFHSRTEKIIGFRETQITERPYGTFTCRL